MILFANEHEILTNHDGTRVPIALRGAFIRDMEAGALEYGIRIVEANPGPPVVLLLDLTKCPTAQTLFGWLNDYPIFCAATVQASDVAAFFSHRPSVAAAVLVRELPNNPAVRAALTQVPIGELYETVTDLANNLCMKNGGIESTTIPELDEMRAEGFLNDLKAMGVDVPEDRSDQLNDQPDPQQDAKDRHYASFTGHGPRTPFDRAAEEDGYGD